MISEEIVAQLRTLCSELEEEDWKDVLLQKVMRMEAVCTETSSPVGKLVSIAVAGSFKCGKSSFINSLLNEPIAPVNTPPTTHCITRFVYGSVERITDERGRRVSRKDYQSFATDKKAYGKEFVIEYPCKHLAGFSIMDAPGFGAPEAGDVCALDGSIGTSSLFRRKKSSG